MFEIYENLDSVYAGKTSGNKGPSKGPSKSPNKGNAEACKADAAGGFALGATVGAAVGSAAGPAGTAGGTLVGGLAGGAAAVSNNSNCGTGGGSGSRVICTHFYKKGMLSQEVWRADMAFTFKNLSPTTVKGYHFWAIPYVKLMRQSPMAEKIMHPLALWRAEELAYQMGVLQKGNFKGKMVRWVGEPICFAIGLFAKQGNWAQLWEHEKLIEKQAAI